MALEPLNQAIGRHRLVVSVRVEKEVLVLEDRFLACRVQVLEFSESFVTLTCGTCGGIASDVSLVPLVPQMGPLLPNALGY